jgi:hypothetical protein
MYVHVNKKFGGVFIMSVPVTRIITLILAINEMMNHFDAAQVTRVELDWEIWTLEPDHVAVAPQISLIMANRVDLSGDFAEFRVNPEYQGYMGGIKVDTWRGPRELDESFYVARPPLNRNEDTVKLTTYVQLDGDFTRYGLQNVSSLQWGSIDNSQLQTCRTADNGLINFSITLTMSESEIEYGHNMVDYIYAKEIRYYIGESLAKRDRTGYYLFKEGKRFVAPESDQEIIDEYIAY